MAHPSRSAPETPTTTVGVAPSHPRAVDRGDSELRRHGHVASALAEMPKPVVVALLRACDDRHGTRSLTGPSHCSNSSTTMESAVGSDDNSRSKMQNVRRDSSDVRHRPGQISQSSRCLAPSRRRATPAQSDDPARAPDGVRRCGRQTTRSYRPAHCQSGRPPHSSPG